MAVLLAGLPVTVPGATVNRLCGSGLEAVIQAARAVALGDAHIAVAGGVESMSRAPWVLPKPERAFPAGDQELFSTTLGWRMVNPRDAEPQWTVPLGEGAELIADKHGITREAAGRVRAGQPREGRPRLEGRRCTTREVVPGRGRRPAPATRPSGTTPPSRRWPGSSRSSARTARSPPATPRRSTTAPPRCCSSTRRA